VQLARARPGQINYGNPGTGTSTHLVTEMFKNDSRIDIVNRINAAIAEVLNTREMKERMIATGFDLAMTTVAEFDAFVTRDVQRYTRVIRESRIRVE
jgi:tripartite-type tricarboxylate transporter receptor subunit TctC